MSILSLNVLHLLILYISAWPKTQSSLRGKQAENTRQIILCIVGIKDVIKLIGKRVLSYRNRNNEAAYTLNYTSLPLWTMAMFWKL